MRSGSLVDPTPRTRRLGALALVLLVLPLLVAGLSACGDLTRGPAPRTDEATPAAPPTPTDVAPAPARVASAPANGFGSAIAWRGLAEGLREAAAEHKPLMLVVHASWCPKCKDLKASFFDPSLVTASDRLVMVNVDQDDEPQSMLYSPDGTYVPRVVFLDPNGQVDRQLRNQARDRFHYFYTPADDLVGMMKQAIARHGQS